MPFAMKSHRAIDLGLKKKSEWSVRYSDILFSEKSISTGEWTKGNFIRKGQTRLEYIRNNNFLLKVEPSTVGQFTGLNEPTDKKKRT